MRTLYAYQAILNGQVTFEIANDKHVVAVEIKKRIPSNIEMERKVKIEETQNLITEIAYIKAKRRDDLRVIPSPRDGMSLNRMNGSKLERLTDEQIAELAKCFDLGEIGDETFEDKLARDL